jgi:hypothetical protein
MVLRLSYRIACRERGMGPGGFLEFRRDLRGMFLPIQREWNPQTPAQFEIAVRKFTGDCK